MGYGNKHPQTVNEAVDILLKGMSEEHKQLIRAAEPDDLLMYNATWGTAIRNSFELWSGNDALLRSTGTSHPDDASQVIIEAVWKKLCRIDERARETSQ